MWFHHFLLLNFSKLYPVRVTKNVEITHAYIRDIPRDDCARNMFNKEKGVNARRNFAFALTPSFSLRVSTWPKPLIKSKTSTRSAVNFDKETNAISMSSKPEPRNGHVVLVSGYLSDSCHSRNKLPLPTEDIMDLLNLCLTSTYFQYIGKHYKQLHGTAMGSPVSVVVAEIVMQHVEERALETCCQTIPLWLRYVDDTFTAVHKDEIDAFHDHLNEQSADIQFTKVIEKNGKLPFLDCLVSRDNNELRTTVYRKPTHTDRLLDESSYNPTSHKATTIKTLTRGAQLVCNTPDSLRDENKYLERVFHKNNYETFTDLPKLTQRTGTRRLLLQ